MKGSKQSIYNKLKVITQGVYSNKISECSKLSLYSSLKTNLVMEPYLKLPDKNIRKSITELRISTHKLPIEIGRWKNIERSNRLCPWCKYSVGTEAHCLLECFHPSLSSARNSYLSKILNINPLLLSLPRDSLLKYILSFTDKSIYLVTGNYINKILKLFANM
jgi:hypothetical protein